MSKKVKITVFVVFPLLFGVLIYALLRDQPPFRHLIPWSTPAIDISSLPRFIRVFIVYRLPDMLWAFSFITALDMRLNNSILSSLIVLSMFITYEYMQYESIVRGTGDVGDIFFVLNTIIIYILTLGRKKNAKIS